MSKIKSIISRTIKQIGKNSSGECICHSVELKTNYVMENKCSLYQMLIEIRINKYDNRRMFIYSFIKKGIIALQAKAKEKEIYTTIFEYEESENENEIVLEILTELPIEMTLEEYYLYSFISEYEFNFHVQQCKEIHSIFMMNKIKKDVNMKDLTFGLFKDECNPFPCLKLTPLFQINYLLGYPLHLWGNYKDNHTISNKPNENSINENKIRFNALENYLKGNYFEKNCVDDENKKQYTQRIEFVPEKLIGKGEYGYVFSGKNMKTKAYIVGKKSEGVNCKGLKKEYVILNMCNHPNIIKCHGFHHKKISDKVSMAWLYLEHCNCDLWQYINDRNEKRNYLSENEIKNIFNQMVSASLYLYNTFGIIHRDIKLENYLVKENTNGIEIKLCDFGLASKGFDEMNDYVGTPLYSAPEILNGIEYSPVSDIFSLGICLYRLIMGKFPFKVNTTEDLLNQYNATNRFNFNNCNFFELVNLCEKLLKIDPHERISWNDLNKSTLRNYVMN